MSITSCSPLSRDKCGDRRPLIRAEPSAPESQDRFIPSPDAGCDRNWLPAGLSMLVMGGAVLIPLAPPSVQGAPPARSSLQTTSKVSNALQKPSVKLTLQRFPRELQSQVTDMSDAQLRVLYGGVSGTTRLGPLSINNREAFIKGSWLGKSVWGNVHQSVSDAQQKWKMINAREAKTLHQVIDQVAQFTPQQRAVLADLLVQVWEG